MGLETGAIRSPRETEMEADAVIRPLRPADAEAWRALRLRALKEEPRAFTSSYEDALGGDAGYWARSIPEEGEASVLFGMMVGGALCGCAGLAVMSGSKIRHKGLMWGVYVAPEARGLGFGRALVAQVIEEARGKVAVLQAGVIAANAAARRIYLGLGFEVYGLERAALRVDGVDIDEELLWIDLRSDRRAA